MSNLPICLAVALSWRARVVHGQAETFQTPPQFVGSQSCATSGCHGGADDKNRQHTVWRKYDVHHERPYATLTTARSERIADTLKLGNPTQAARCTVCHAPLQTVPAARFARPMKISEGVSCENCHGPAEQWLLSHTRKDYTHADRVHAGLRDLKNLYVRANTCVACHQNVDADILAAGHPELIFELDGQCVTQPKHWQETTNWNGAQAWLVGQAVAYREMSWQLAPTRTPNPTVNQINRWKSLGWLTAKISGIIPVSGSVPCDCDGSLYYCEQLIGDSLARGAAQVSWAGGWTSKVLSALADSSKDFLDTSVPQPLQARRAERLVLALDRLTLALPDANAIDQLRSPLKKLFADVQSLPDFAPATFADHLQEFQKALPTPP